MKKEQTPFGLNVGTSLFLVVLVLLSLICFSVLSLASAKSDHRLSTQTGNHTKEYYTTDKTCKEQVAVIINTAQALLSQGKFTDTYFDESLKASLSDDTLLIQHENDMIYITFCRDLNLHQYLDVAITLSPDESKNTIECDINSWQIKNKD